MYKILANTIFLGKDVQFLPECHSTNDIALSLAKEQRAYEGTVVITDHQIQGKGQRGNKWLTDKGLNLTFSLILKPAFLDISEQFYLNMAVSNSIRKLLQEYIPNLQVKWPNDLVLPDFGKIGGILIENTYAGMNWECAVVGIGINVNQIDFENQTATSLAKVTGSHFELSELFRLLVTQIEQGYLQLKRGKWHEIKSEYLHHLYLKDIWSNYEDSNGTFIGKIKGISGQGKLEMERENGEFQVFDLKEVVFRALS
jgi:BirA family transcriptional regulator, biotin operon repressor / biotin---[acetyl-CoA-carboxylase] ligase